MVIMMMMMMMMMMIIIIIYLKLFSFLISKLENYFEFLLSMLKK